VPISDLIREHGISRPTYFNRRAKYDGERLKDLSAENAKLKRARHYGAAISRTKIW
jgi:hypothetical protein